MTASISVSARTAGRVSADRFAGFGPLFRKELGEWAHSKRVWVILAVTTMFMVLTAANAAINSWIIANVPDATVSGGGAISLDATVNFLAAVSTQIFVVVAIFASMGLLVAERDRGTLAWVASKPVSRGAIWLSKWAAAGIVVAIVTGIIPMAVTFGLVAVLYGSAGVAAFVFAAVGVAASIAFMIAVVLAVSTVIANQSAVAAIGFAVFFLPQILVSLVPVDISPFLPTSIISWAMGPVIGAEMGFVTPIAWAVSVIALVGFASWRMERMEF
jgi:ABC-type transport system involved in multi-copper enzyme maturation permease subunit